MRVLSLFEAGYEAAARHRECVRVQRVCDEPARGCVFVAVAVSTDPRTGGFS